MILKASRLLNAPREDTDAQSKLTPFCAICGQLRVGYKTDQTVGGQVDSILS